MGCGWYSSKLSYKQWFQFNVAQRIHGNFLEQLVTVTLLILIAGLKYPAYTFYAGIAYSIGRLLMAIGYMIQTKDRRPGFIFLNLALGVLFYMSIDTLLSLKNGAVISVT